MIVDEAQNLGLDSLEELRMLSNINADKDQYLQIILIGQPQLKDLLRSPELLQFAQRVSSDFHLKPLNPSEVKEYINYRLKAAGAECATFFKRGLPGYCARQPGYSAHDQYSLRYCADLRICCVGKVDYRRDCNNGHRKQIAIWRAAADGIDRIEQSGTAVAATIELRRFSGRLLIFAWRSVSEVWQALVSTARMPWRIVPLQYSSCQDGIAPGQSRADWRRPLREVVSKP